MASLLVVGDEPPQQFQVGTRQRLLALDAATGQLRWQTPVYSRSFTATGDTVYTFWRENDNQYFSAVRLSDGAELYRHPVEFFLGYTYEPIIWGENIYLYEGSRLHAFRRADGASLWSFHDENNSSTVDVNIAASSGTILISQAQRLLGIDAASGQQAWALPTR